MWLSKGFTVLRFEDLFLFAPDIKVKSQVIITSIQVCDKQSVGHEEPY